MDRTSVAIGISVGFSVLGGLLLACLIKHLWGKIKCPKCLKCKRKKPSMKDKVLEKVGVKKTEPSMKDKVLEKVGVKKTEPSMKNKVLEKVGVKKSKPPKTFSISTIVEKK